MTFRSKFVCSVTAILLQFGLMSAAMADGVLVCDNCTWSQERTKALGGPLGWTYVADLQGVNLTLWEVRKDGETKIKTADELPVDSATYNHFLYVLEAKVQAQAAGADHVVINVNPGDAIRPIFIKDPFGGFSTINAYDVVTSVTVRNQLGTNIALAMATAGSGTTALEKLAITLNSYILASGMPGGFKIVITWGDGSKTTYTVDASTTNQAKYRPGESRDRNGNPIPDSSVHTSEGGGDFAGQFYFDSSDSLQKWLDAAVMNGVPITGTPSGSNRMSCTWDGRTLKCKYL